MDLIKPKLVSLMPYTRSSRNSYLREIEILRKTVKSSF